MRALKRENSKIKSKSSFSIICTVEELEGLLDMDDHMAITAEKLLKRIGVKRENVDAGTTSTS